MDNKHKNKFLSIKELLGQDKYLIPRYQRNYAWKSEDIIQLIQDIADSAERNPERSFYLGTLVTCKRKTDSLFEIVDGQQRLTALSIILCAIKHLPNASLNLSSELEWFKAVNLAFAQREQSSNILKQMFDRGKPVLNGLRKGAPDPLWVSYQTALNEVSRKIGKEEQQNSKETTFLDYLFHKVFLVRTELPKGTDLTRYFETMNNRGEQLEPHEIVKTRLISALPKNQVGDANQEAFNQIWEACSQMDKYVYEAFNKESRDVLFKQGSFNTYRKNAVSTLAEYITNKSQQKDKNFKPSKKTETSTKSLEELLTQPLPYDSPEKERGNSQPPTPEFSALINFPNFLLLVLKIMRPGDPEIALNDKRLIEIFDKVFEREEKTSFSERFATNLLHLRFLFDNYIIKRHREESWSLEKVTCNKDVKEDWNFTETFSTEKENSGDYPALNPNERIIKLQSMFHVSYPANNYKYWMYAALRYVAQNPTLDVEKFETFLWKMAKAYMLNRYLATNENEDGLGNLQLSLAEIVSSLFKEGSKGNLEEVSKIKWDNINIGSISQRGEDVEHFAFNFFDYLLWKRTMERDTRGIESRSFTFKYRNSVEHFYPQDPFEGNPIDERHLQSFGNLFLVTNSTNSGLSNRLPRKKAQVYGETSLDRQRYSLKLAQAMKIALGKETKWDKEMIGKKEAEAQKIIQEELEKDSPWSLDNSLI